MITGASSAFTETVAPMPSPIHTARRTVTSSRHRRTIAIVAVANASAAPSAAIGPVIQSDVVGDAHEPGGEERAAAVGDGPTGHVGGSRRAAGRRPATAAAGRSSVRSPSRSASHTSGRNSGPWLEKTSR